MGQAMRQMLVILSAGMLLGLAANMVNPRGVPLLVPFYAPAQHGTDSCEVDESVLTMALETAAELCVRCEAAFVDARSAAAYANGHIAGAVHLPPRGHPDEQEVIAQLRNHNTAIVYGDNTRCDQAHNVALRLAAAGHPNVRVLEGGWPAWVERGEPATSGACTECTHAEHAGADHRGG